MSTELGETEEQLVQGHSRRPAREGPAAGDRSPELAGDSPEPADEAPEPARERTVPRIPTMMWVAIFILVTPGTLSGFVQSAALENWGTVFLSLSLQALPFLVMGVSVSAAIAALVPMSWLERALPRRTHLAVPAAGLAGAALPGCECSSVPVAGRLIARGVPQAAALTFLLAAPAINPVVLVSTAVAFPGHPEMVWARFSASLLAAVGVGLLWTRFAKSDWLEQRMVDHRSHSHGRNFIDTAMSDFLQAGGFLIVGAALVATLQTIGSHTMLDFFADSGVLAVLAMAGLAIVLSICSEADAFVVAGFTQFSLTSRLTFLVVGPMVDVKLFSLHAGTFGRRFALRFNPLVLVTALGVSVVVGGLLL